MAFLIKDELKTKSHIEFIDAIIQNDDTIIDMIISESISYMKGFLSSRYLVDEIFNATGTKRDLTVVKILKSIVIYEIYTSHNPALITQHMKDANDRANDWLKQVRAGKINPALPTPTSDDDPKEYIQFGSNPKRNNHY